jgi:Glyoxalase-like domain
VVLERLRVGLLVLSVFLAGAKLDHIGIAVPDIAQARRDFQAAGFHVSPIRRAGAEVVHAAIPFPDGTYLELLSASKRTAGDSRVFDAQQRDPGPVFVGFEAPDLNGERARLTARGFPMAKVVTSRYSSTLGFAQPAGVMDPFFYISYTRHGVAFFQHRFAPYEQHPIRALGLRGLEVAVREPGTAQTLFSLAELTGLGAVRGGSSHERIAWVELATSSPAMRGKSVRVDGLEIRFR